MKMTTDEKIIFKQDQLIELLEKQVEHYKLTALLFLFTNVATISFWVYCIVVPL